eukprot:TRINITY_DN3087_c0_g1_i1.p1 TRINITY_DN3087_c0_g1~~TRINITY_DN3087_c0_g1_i1.p1  ORF type:complete len:437 (+),score=147.07 TRINITY_DN3087_c0_g1_i1:75-1385(+)
MAASFLEKYSHLGGDATAETQHYEVMRYVPEFRGSPSCRAIDINASALETKNVLLTHGVLKAALEALSSAEEKEVQWLLTVFYDVLRADSSCYGIFDEALKNKLPVFSQFMAVLRSKSGSYAKDKAAWVLSAVVGYLPQYFSQNDVAELIATVCGRYDQCTPLGSLEAICNLLKADLFRTFVWSQGGVQACIFDVEPKTAQPPLLYKCVFAIWLMSFEKRTASTMEEMRKRKVVEKVRDVLAVSRVEKVVRMSLTVLKNFMEYKPFCEDMVDCNMLECVQAVEYEKWRDAELYDEIRELCGVIAGQVQEMSNFDRYEHELKTGSLKWGYTHTSKFWGENVMKFEANDFRALRSLAQLLLSPTTDNTTLAVACHDMGEFVALHPLGKRKVAQLQVKERIMELMGAEGDDKREVRREALLCCQKIMLNKWQDLEKSQK